MNPDERLSLVFHSHDSGFVEEDVNPVNEFEFITHGYVCRGVYRISQPSSDNLLIYLHDPEGTTFTNRSKQQRSIPDSGDQRILYKVANVYDKENMENVRMFDVAYLDYPNADTIYEENTNCMTRCWTQRLDPSQTRRDYILALVQHIRSNARYRNGYIFIWANGNDAVKLVDTTVASFTDGLVLSWFWLNNVIPQQKDGDYPMAIRNQWPPTYVLTPLAAGGPESPVIEVSETMKNLQIQFRARSETAMAQFVEPGMTTDEIDDLGRIFNNEMILDTKQTEVNIAHIQAWLSYMIQYMTYSPYFGGTGRDPG